MIRRTCQTMLNVMHHKHLTLQKQWPNVCWKGYHWTHHDLPSLHEQVQISMEPFDSQPTGEVDSPNEDYLYESRYQPTHNFAVSILMIFYMPVSIASSSS